MMSLPLNTFPATLLTLPHLNYMAILPEIILLGGALFIMLLTSLSRRPMNNTAAMGWTIMTACVALGFSIYQWVQVTPHGAYVAFDSSLVVDGLSSMVAVLVSSSVVVAALMEEGWLRRQGRVSPEIYMLTLVSAAGAMLMGAANDLIVVFLGLEIMSIGLYVLAAYDYRRKQSGEAALKYLILGGLSSAIFLYGIALTYGATGTMNLAGIASYLSKNILLHDGLLLAGIAMMLVGLCFKVGAVPFHMWAPDVYQGSPSPATGYMASVAKIGGFAALLRIFISALGSYRSDWQPAIWIIAAATLILGAVMALVQKDIKRMLAYSSINHAGFILLGLAAASTAGVSASLYYVFVYSFMVMGSFAVVSVVGGSSDSAHDLSNYRGLHRRSPWLAWALALMLLAQAGIPLTTGFIAKLEVLAASIGAHVTWLAVVAMVTAAIAAFFYLRVVLLMFSTATPGSSGELSDEHSGEEAVPIGVTASALGVESVAGMTSSSVSATLSAAGGSAKGSAKGRVSEDPTGHLRAADQPVAYPVEGIASSKIANMEIAEGDALMDDNALMDDMENAATLPEGDDSIYIPPSTAVAIAICAAVTLFFGIVPASLTAMAHAATMLIR
ncbi:MAG: NADH-quinone oxidoreductase subunit N [Actinobacteria bacterium]|nr:NADH-quinone oxidoreductase subunit N [Actinomycetota bacterium]